MVYWWSLGSVDVCLEPTESREHLVSLNISFQWVLQEDNALRSDCNRVQSSEKHTGRRNLVSSAKRNVSECFKDGRSLMYTRGEDQADFPGEHLKLLEELELRSYNY